MTALETLATLHPHMAPGPLASVVASALAFGDDVHAANVLTTVQARMPHEDQGKVALKSELVAAAREHAPVPCAVVSVGMRPPVPMQTNSARELVIFEPTIRHVLLAPDQIDRVTMIIPQRGVTTARHPEHWLHRLDPWLAMHTKEIPTYATAAELDAYQRATAKKGAK